MKNHLLFPLLIVLLFISCTDTIDFDDEGYANLLTVNSFIWSNAGFSANTYNTSSILMDRQAAQVADGTMDLYENGTLLKHLSSTGGLFWAPEITPKAGQHYRMVVSSNGRQVEAETTIPAKVEVMSIDTSSNSGGFGARTIHFKIRIKDTPGEDYYRIVVTNENMVQVSDQNEAKTRRYFVSSNQSPLNSEDPVFKSVYNNLGDDLLDMGPQNSYYIFPDDYFKDQEYSVHLDASNNLYYFGGYGNNKVIYDHYIVHVQRLSKDLYAYLKYLKLYENYRENPFAEPVAVYSNVKNGTGIFAGFNDDARYSFEAVYIPYSMDTIKVETGGSGGYSNGY
ncbi:MAG TPA: DUF4249 domain-containing protein [Prolixibacteraceae bacterium]|jgi:hypothetical protein